MKLDISFSISISVLIYGTFVFKSPFPIFSDAEIKLFIETKKREENLIAIVIDKNNNSVTNILTSPMYNSDTSWNYGAFGVNKSSNMMDYGWGSYNIVNHHIVGDSLFIIKTVDGNYKKLWMDRKASGTYYFKFADLDGSNEIISSVPASTNFLADIMTKILIFCFV